MTHFSNSSRGCNFLRSAFSNEIKQLPENNSCNADLQGVKPKSVLQYDTSKTTIKDIRLSLCIAMMNYGGESEKEESKSGKTLHNLYYNFRRVDILLTITINH
jgi:hypothetical protein